MKTKHLFYSLFALLVVTGLLAGCAAVPAAAPAASTGADVASADAPVSLVYLVDDSPPSQARAKAFVDAYMAQNPNVTITIESRPGGTEGDNLIKTRLATGEMPDVFWYNSGSLMQALNPSESLVDLSGEPFIANVAESYLPTVSQGEAIFGVPGETAMGGGILYNKKVYADLGLSVPLTWEEFAANNEVIKAAGIAPVIATYGDSWTSQLFVLADYYNVAQAVPTFTADFTANQAKYATTPAALEGFKHLQEGYEKGWWQQDFATAKFDQGLQLLAEGKGAHYPMLTFALTTLADNFPEQIDDIGFFAQPGNDAATNGATIWMPAATYLPQTTQNAAAAKDFLAFIASTEGVDAQNAAVVPSGPYVIKGATLPDDVISAVRDVATYIDNGNAGPALEFLSPVKGPSLEQITVAVGTGQMTAEEGAAAYDADVEKQAQQLGLPGW